MQKIAFWSPCLACLSHAWQVHASFTTLENGQDSDDQKLFQRGRSVQNLRVVIQQKKQAGANSAIDSLRVFAKYLTTFNLLSACHLFLETPQSHAGAFNPTGPCSLFGRAMHCSCVSPRPFFKCSFARPCCVHSNMKRPSRTTLRFSMLEPGDLWAAYEAAAKSNSWLTDMLTCGCINIVSDSVAQVTEPQVRADGSQLAKPDIARNIRFCVFGIADGAVSHVWFEALDQVVGEDGSIAQTVLKSAADALVYTPIWCAWFLACFVILEGRDLRTIPSVVLGEWLELFRGNLGFFLPITGLIYGFVPRDERVLAFGVASLIYTTILSAWNSARPGAEYELCNVGSNDSEDCVAIPVQPPRSAASLSFGIRRVIVSARRNVRRRTGSTRMSGSNASDRQPQAAEASAAADWKDKVLQVLTDIFVVESRDFLLDTPDSVRDDSISQFQGPVNRSLAAFNWGSSEEDEALRLPGGAAAAERLMRQQLKQMSDLEAEVNMSDLKAEGSIFGDEEKLRALIKKSSVDNNGVMLYAVFCLTLPALGLFFLLMNVVFNDPGNILPLEE